jgi:DHA1 family tetracycline resistance protein-like MFS transporter
VRYRTVAPATPGIAVIATSASINAPAASPSNVALVFLLLTAFVNSMGMGLTTPVMPALLVELTGGDIADAAFWGGVALVSYALMQFFFSPIVGALSDRFGRRPVLLFSLSAFAVDMLLLAIVDRLWLFILVRGAAGIFAATFSTTSAYIADVTPPERRAQRFALIGAAFGAGFVFGPVIGGTLGDLDTRLPFFAGAVLAGANATFGAFLVRESLAKERRRPFRWKRANALGTVMSLKAVPGVGRLLPVYFLSTLSTWVYPTVWAYAAKAKFLWSESDIGFSIAYYGIISFLAQAAVLQMLLPRMGVRKAVWVALTVEVFALTGIGFATAGWMVYAMVTTALVSTMQDPALRQELSSRVPADAQGELQGGLSALTSIAMIVAPLLYNSLFTLSTGSDPLLHFAGLPFVVAAGCSVLALLFYVRALRRD